MPLVQGQPSNSSKTKCRLVVKDWSVCSNIFVDGPSDKSIKTTVHALHSHRTPMNIKEGWDSHTEHSLPMRQWLSFSGTKGHTVTRGCYIAGGYASTWRENSCKSKIWTTKCIGLFVFFAGVFFCLVGFLVIDIIFLIALQASFLEFFSTMRVKQHVPIHMSLHSKYCNQYNSY